MSVAGILASSLFANAGSQIAQKAPSAVNGLISGAQSTFAALQQGLSGTGSSSSTGATSAPVQLAQLGQDLKLGNLPAAQTDFANFQLNLQQGHLFHARYPHAQPESTGGSSSQTVLSGVPSQSGVSSDPLTAAMQAYSSLQLNPINNVLGTSLATPAATFAIDA